MESVQEIFGEGVSLSALKSIDSWTDVRDYIETLGEEGGGSHFTFTVSVKVGDKEQIATGSSKKRAYAAAAEAFLRRLKTEES